jgi:hypothetical protein
LTTERKKRMYLNGGVRAHSGMSRVIPAWRLANLLNSPEAVAVREKADEIGTQTKLKTNTN